MASLASTWYFQCRRLFIAASLATGLILGSPSLHAGNDFATHLIVDNSENIFITGRTNRGGADDFATLKYNCWGVQQWKTLFNGSANYHDIPSALAADSAGNVYVTGGSIGLNTKNDYVTIKYNCNGVQQWIARFNGTAKGDDIPSAIAVDCYGNTYVTGKSLGLGSGFDFVTIKYNCNGVQQWLARYNGPANGADMPVGIAIDGLGNVYVGGSSLGLGSGQDYAVIKYNCNGVRQWVARYNGLANGDDMAAGIALDCSWNLYITGKSLGLGSGQDYATVKYNCEGQLQWAMRYNGPANGNDTASAIAVDSWRNVYVTGSSLGLGTGLDFATVKYNCDGVPQWVARLTGSANGDDWAAAIALDNCGSPFITGKSLGSGSSWDFLTAKYNRDGEQQWTMRYNGPANGDDSAVALGVGWMSSNVYVGGTSLGLGTGSDFATVKYNADGVQQWVTRYNGP